MRTIKILSLFIIVLFVVALLVVTNIDVNRFKPEIEAQLESLVGQPVELSGEMVLELFPPLSLDVGSGQIANPPDFPTGQMFAFKELSVGVDLIAFLFGEIKVEQLVLLGAEIHIFENSAGQLNWSTLADAQESPTPQGDTNATQAEKPWTDTLSVAGISLKESRILWHDAKGKIVADFSKLDLETGRIEIGKPVDLQLTSDLRSDVYPFSGNVSLVAEALLPKGNEPLEIKNLAITGDGTWQDTGGAAISLEKMKVGGNISAKLDSQMIVMRALNASVVIKNPELQEALALSLATDGTADLKAGKLELGNINGAVGKAHYKGALSVVALNTKPQGSFSLQTGSFDPQELARALGLELPEQAPNKARLDAKLGFDAKGLTVHESNIALGDTNLTVQGRYNWSPNQNLKGKIKLDRIVLDDYLPRTNEKEEEEKKDPAPLSGIFRFPVSLTLDIGKLRYKTTEADEVHARLIASKRMFYLQDFRAKAFTGELKADAILNEGTKASRSKGRLKNIELQKALKTFLGDESWLARIKGQLNSNWELSAKSAEVVKIPESLSGKADVLLENATIFNKKFIKKLETAVLLLNGGKAVTENLEAIHSLAGAVTFVNGIGKITKLKGNTALFNINGRGNIDLKRNLLDLRVSLHPKKLLQFDQTIPLRIRGDMSDPTYSLDVKDILKKEAEKKIKEAVQEKIEEKIKEGAGKKIQDLLKEKLNF